MSACHIEGCDGPVRGHGMCIKHWKRWRKWGDPYWVEPKIGAKPHNFRQSGCDVAGCDGQHHAHGYCSRHAATLRKHGNPTTRGNKGRKRKQEITHAGAHKRVRYDRGPATDHVCIDCGEQAAEWSCRHDVSPESRREEYINSKGRRILQVYSLNSQDYDPRCRSCHRKYDRAITLEPIEEPS